MRSIVIYFNRIVISLGFLILIVHCNVTMASDTVKVTYIGNTGFLVEINNKKILIDALFDKEDFSYHAPSAETLSDMIACKPPYNNIDIITTSHHHRDHFDAKTVIAHLKNNPDGVFVSTRQTVDILKEDSLSFVEIETQVKEITPDKYKSSEIEIDDVKVKILRLRHLPSFRTDYDTGKRTNIHKQIQNLGFIFDVNGTKIFHCGDAVSYWKKEWEIFRLDQENIDLAFIDRLFFYSSKGPGIEIIKELIKPKPIVLMHIDPENFEMYEVAQEEAITEEYSITLFKNPGDKKTFNLE